MGGDSDSSDDWGAYWEGVSDFDVAGDSVDCECSVDFTVSMCDYDVSEYSYVGSAVPYDSDAYSEGAVGVESGNAGV